MAFYENHILLAWGGPAPGGEIWTNTLRLRSSGAGGFPTHGAIEDWLAGGVKDALATWWGQVDVFIGPGTKLAWAKLNAVGTDGKYLDDTTNRYDWPAALPGAAGANHPNQNAIVITTTTAAARGRAHAGRFYLPSVTVTVDGTTGLFTASEATNLATYSATLMEDLMNACDDPGPGYAARPAVFSNIGGGVYHDITGIRVGRVVDTQRRRRNKVLEQPQYIAV